MANNLYQDLPLTDFPQSEDQFTTWLNIIASDGPLILQYQSALQEGNTTLANQILSQIPNGTQKIIKAVDLNKYSEAILALERFYNGDIQPYIESKQQSWTNTINQFRYRGTWSSGTTYQVNNLVSYTTSGIALIYIATSTPPRGTVPTNTRYWRPMTIRGPQGNSGVGLSYRQEWNVSTQYQTNDAVTYNGVLWAALKNNQSVQPGTNSSIWKSVITFETATYPIQDTEPQGLVEGDLWFNTQGNPTNYVYLEPLTNPIEANMIPIGYQTYDSQGQVLQGQGPLPVASGGTNAVDNQNALNNLGAGVRPNLLINPFFKVNQKRQDSYTGKVYGYDGWKGTRTNTVISKTNNIVSIVDSTTREGGCTQKIEERFDGKTLTASILLTQVEGAVKIWIRNDSNFNTYAFAFTQTPGLLTITGEIPSDYPGNLIFYLDGTGTGSGTTANFSFIACKLEEGNTQTLAYENSTGTWELLPQQESDYSTQLLKCQRYYQLYSSADIRPSKAIDCRPEMRIDPTQGTVLINDTTYYYNDAIL